MPGRSCCCSAGAGLGRWFAAKPFALPRDPLQYGAENHCRANGDTMAPIKFGVGQSVLRKEDDALIRGKGRYTDDVAAQPSLHALVLRSPHAHATYTLNA